MKIKSILIDTDEGHFFIGTSVIKAKTFTGVERKLKGKNIVAMVKIDDDDDEFLVFIEE
tara:strand:+ start:132 stop:308 length:177 start_codon:yes stop_codon:yes gene_type:complete